MVRERHGPAERTVDALAQEEHGRAQEFLGRTASDRRMTISCLVLLAVVGILLVRAFDLQVLRNTALRRQATANTTRQEILPPTRGRIVDRHGAALVRNEQRYAIGVVPADLPSGDARASALVTLATAIDVTPAVLATTIAAYPAHLTEPVILHEALAYADAIRILLAARDQPAVRLIAIERREYRGAAGRDLESLSHVIGYVGRVNAEEYPALAAQRYRPSDRVGKVGVEASYESILRGTPGVRTTTVDARGRVVHVLAEELPISGGTLTVTIDLRLQEVAERALRHAFRTSGARRGAVIALDPRNGEVLALVSLPAFSHSTFARGVDSVAFDALLRSEDRPLFPRATAGLYPPGSTVKPLIAAVALSVRALAPTTRILSNGGIAVGASFFPDWRLGGHGAVTVREAIAYSVNTFFYVLGGGWPRDVSRAPPYPTRSSVPSLGPEGLADAFRAFGLGQPTGIDLPTDARGFIPTPEWKRATGARWYIGDTYHLAIGQGDLLLTPLQLAVATAAIANGGTLVTPHVAIERQLPSTGRNHRTIPGVTNDALRVVREGMRLAVTQGTARALADLPTAIAGKTGTAEIGGDRRPHAWFVGFTGIGAPLVLTVLVEEAGEGSAVAVPVAHTIFAWWATHRDR